MSAPSILNIAAYKFVDLDAEWIRSWRFEIRSFCRERGVFGTILLSEEGINLFLAGPSSAVEEVWSAIRSIDAFSDLQRKDSFSETVPFLRMKVKLKKEIIPMGQNIQPAKGTAPRVQAKDLKAWLDEGREVIMFDTRNDYEVDYGTFDNAMILDIKHFRTFPEKVAALDPSLKSKTIVTFCTGGIRCEKAGAFMAQQGFEHVYQLDGGILKYFEEVGGAHYHGGCFVFDERVSLDPELQSEVEAVMHPHN